jgi:hypothetical protein
MSALQGSHDGRQVLNDIGGARRPDGRWGAQCRCGQAYFEHLSTHSLKRKSCQINIHAPRLAFGQQGHHFMCLYFAQCKGALKRGQPTMFYLLN